MDEEYNIKFIGNITSTHFFNNIIPQLNNYFDGGKTKQVRFDFSETTAINVTAVAYILSAADAIKNSTKRQVKLFLPAYFELQKLTRFLIDISFFYIADKYNLFEYEDTVGNIYSDDLYGDISETYFIKSYDPSKLSKSERCLAKEGIFWNNLLGTTQHINPKSNENKYEEILKVLQKVNLGKVINNSITEFFSNCLRWGESRAFVSGCLIKSWNSLYIVMSDVGKGLDFNRMKERKKEFSENDNLIFQNSNKYHEEPYVNDNCKKILEALFFRRGKLNFKRDDGIYSIAQALAKYVENNPKKKVTFRIHSNRCKVRLTNHQLLELCSDAADKINESAFEKKVFKLLTSDSKSEYPSIAATNKFLGVHIELEIEY